MDASDKKEKDISRKPQRKTVFFLSITLFLFILAVAAWLYLQKPGIGTVKVGMTQPQNEASAQAITMKQYQGKYVDFSYPDSYVEAAHDIPKYDPVVEERVFLTSPDREGKKIAIVVEKRLERSLESSPSYRLRMNDSKTYQREPITFEGISGVLFTKNSQVYEKTAFFQRGTSVLSVSVTSPIRLETLREGLGEILYDFQWKNE